MKPNREKFLKNDDDWIHTEVLGGSKKKANFFSNCVVILVLFCFVVLVVVAFKGMFSKTDLSDLENLDKIKKQVEEETKIVIEEEELEEEKVEDLVYIVESGDTLAYVGEQFGVSWESIAERNGLEEPYALEVGQELVIPGVKKETKVEEEEAPTNPTAEAGTYIVGDGDTLAGIGLELDIAWELIAEANELEEPFALSVGQTLIIPQE